MSSLAFAAIVLLALASPGTAEPLEGNWNSFNRGELEKLIATLGKTSPDYDPAHPPYAVFDWDNTSVFLDVEEATLVYQLDNLAFAATPAQLDKALRTGTPSDAEVEALLDDISQSYSWLYLRLRAGGSLAELKGSPHLESFRAKFLLLYQLLEEKHGAAVAYPWMPHRFAGMTDSEVRGVTHQAVEWQLGQPIETVQWESHPSLPGKAGMVTVSWRNGLRLVPEMQALYQNFRSAGFDVWVCTASFAEGIREVSSSSDFGYGHPPDQVIGLELERDDQGRYLPQRKAGSEITFKEGKTQAIRRLLISRYGYGPAFVAGDSNGDANMMVDFPDTRLSLVMDLKLPEDSPIGQLAALARAQRGKPGARFLVQERDESSGQLVP